MPESNVPPGVLNTCVICRQDICARGVFKTACCGSAYHASCILTWIRTSQSCPICRGELFKDDVNDSDYVPSSSDDDSDSDAG